MTNTSKTITWLGIILILTIGGIHTYDEPDSFADAAYKGWLFCANGIGCVAVAFAIYSGRRWGWNLGLVIAALSFIGYCLSRTVGLPYIPAEPENWLEPLGVASLVAEGLFIVVYLGRVLVRQF